MIFKVDFFKLCLIIFFIDYHNSLIFTYLKLLWCENQEHLVRMFGTYCALFVDIGADFQKTLPLVSPYFSWCEL
jgi:hypothetical protein